LSHFQPPVAGGYGSEIADERLEVSVPLSRSIDRRREHVSVEELRCQLRDADRHRFELEAALSGAARRWLAVQDVEQPPEGRPTRAWHRWHPWHPRPAIALLTLLTVSVCGAFVEWAPPRESLPAASPQVTVESRRISARVVQEHPAKSVSIPAPPTAVLAARPAPRLRAERQIGSRDHSFKRHVWVPAPSRSLHPLSPGEFGRRRLRQAG
jgi:hypothetical protein